MNYFLAFLVFRTRKSCQKSHFGIKMQLAEPKMHFATYKTKTMARGPLRRVRGPERNQTVSARRAASKFLKPSFENLKSQNGSWGAETILDRKIWFFYIWSFFCESLRLQNRFQTTNLLFGAPGFRFCYLFGFSLKYSVPLIRMSFSVMFFMASCYFVVVLHCFSFSPTDIWCRTKVVPIQTSASGQIAVENNPLAGPPLDPYVCRAHCFLNFQGTQGRLPTQQFCESREGASFQLRAMCAIFLCAHERRPEPRANGHVLPTKSDCYEAQYPAPRHPSVTTTHTVVQFC